MNFAEGSARAGLVYSTWVNYVHVNVSLVCGGRGAREDQLGGLES